jgi:hypothetical protein
MEAERRRAGQERERRDGERRLVDRDTEREEGADIADGAADTEDVRSGGESDGEVRQRGTAYPPLGWTQDDLDQQAAARQLKRQEREMRVGGTRLDDGEGEGVGGSWGWGPLRRWRLRDSTAYR